MPRKKVDAHRLKRCLTDDFAIRDHTHVSCAQAGVAILQCNKLHFFHLQMLSLLAKWHAHGMLIV